MTLSLVFPNYKIRSYLSRTLSLGIILPSSYSNMGICRPPMGLPSHLSHVTWVHIVDSSPQVFSTELMQSRPGRFCRNEVEMHYVLT
jgi:hypothetical protein